MHYKLTTEPEFNGHPINVGRYNNLPCREDILEVIHDRLIYMTGFSRFFILRFDIHFPWSFHADGSNTDISDFFGKFKKSLDYKRGPVHYVWVKEKAAYDPFKPFNSNNHHYHCLLICRNTRHHDKILKRARKLWTKQLKLPADDASPLIHYCDGDGPCKNGQVIDKSDPAYNKYINDWMHYASYLSKTSTKAITGDGRQFGRSELHN